MNNSQKGFTLIEMLIAITLIGVIGTIATEMFSRIILVAKKTSMQTEIKRNSESVLSQLDRIFRNATMIEYLGRSDDHGQYFDWTDPDTLTTPPLDPIWRCQSTASTDCSIIVRNADNNSNLFTRLTLSQQATSIASPSEPRQQCHESVYNNQTIVDGSNVSCNGAVKLAVGSDAAILSLYANPDLSLTNTHLDSGVNIRNANIEAYFPPSRPPILKITITFTQPIRIFLRNTAEVERDFTSIISLRNY